MAVGRLHPAQQDVEWMRKRFVHCCGIKQMINLMAVEVDLPGIRKRLEAMYSIDVFETDTEVV